MFHRCALLCFPLNTRVVSKSFRTLSSIATYLAAAAFAILRAAPAYLLKNVA